MTAGYGTPTPQTSPPDMISMRFTSTGALDTTYANNGIFRYDGQGAADRARDLTLIPDGRIFLAGATETLVTGVGAATNALAVVLKPNGTLDTSFGKGGVLQVDPGGTADWFYGTTLLPSGKVVAVGYKGGVPTSGDDASIARFDVGYVPAPVAAIAGIKHNATLKRGPSTLAGTVTPTTDVATRHGQAHPRHGCAPAAPTTSPSSRSPGRTARPTRASPPSTRRASGRSTSAPLCRTAATRSRRSRRRSAAPGRP